MSYILEALKKAQAERQLGATPTIHAPTLDAAAARGTASTQWKPLALAAGALVIAGAAALAWHQQSAPAAPAAGTAVPAALAAAAPAAPAAATLALSGPAPAMPAAPAAVAAAAPADAAPAPPAASAAAAQAPGALSSAAARPPHPQGSALPAPSSSPAAPVPPPLQVAAEPAKPAQPVKPAPAAVAEVTEEPVQLLRDLPEPIQRSIPPITMGGYMYSKNPADRLVLIDKILRREGEEVAPGLVLDKLLPKAAIFTFKGYRYRVPY